MYTRCLKNQQDNFLKMIYKGDVPPYCFNGCLVTTLRAQTRTWIPLHLEDCIWVWRQTFIQKGVDKNILFKTVFSSNCLSLFLIDTSSWNFLSAISSNLPPKCHHKCHGGPPPKKGAHLGRSIRGNNSPYYLAEGPNFF
jgi:hypothetical protein